FHDGNRGLQGRVAVFAERAVELFTQKAGLFRNPGHPFGAGDHAKCMRNVTGILSLECLFHEYRDCFGGNQILRWIIGSQFLGARFAHFLLLQFFSQALRSLDIFGLSTLVTTTKQKDDGFALPAKINAISRSVVDAQFADTLAEGLHVAGVSVGEAIKPGRDRRASTLIPELRPPFAENFRSASARSRL